MSLSRVAALRSQAQDFNIKGREFGVNGDWGQAAEQFIKAINAVTQIEQENRTDDDFRTLAKYQHNAGISHYNIYSEHLNDEHRVKALDYLAKAIDTMALIKKLTDQDEEALANYNRLVYTNTDPLVRPVSDAFEEYTHKLIDELESALKGKQYSDQDYRKLSRWNFCLGNSMYEENREQRLQTAISMQLKVVKRFDWDERELTSCYITLAEACEKDGLMKDAADACNKAADCMKKIKTSNPGDKDAVQDIDAKLKKYGDNPQNNKKESALSNHGFWMKFPMESSTGEKSVVYVPSSMFGNKS